VQVILHQTPYIAYDDIEAKHRPKVASQSGSTDVDHPLWGRRPELSNGFRLRQDCATVIIRGVEVDFALVFPPDRSLTSRAKHWIVYACWEVREARFRSGLLQLTHYISVLQESPEDESVNRLALAAEIWAGDFEGNDVVPARAAQNPLVSNDGATRHAAILRFGRFMCAWPFYEEKLLPLVKLAEQERLPLTLREQDEVSLETGTWRFYMQTYYDYFRHAPTLPVRLMLRETEYPWV